MTTTIKANFVLDDITKGAFRYKEIDERGNPKTFQEASIGTFYVRKSAVKGEPPEKISVTVELQPNVTAPVSSS